MFLTCLIIVYLALITELRQLAAEENSSAAAATSINNPFFAEKKFFGGSGSWQKNQWDYR